MWIIKQNKTKHHTQNACVCVWVVYITKSSLLRMYVYQSSNLSTYLSVCSCVCMYVCSCVCLSVCLFVCLSVCLSLCMYVCLSVYQYVCMHFRFSVCLYVCLYVCMLFLLLLKPDLSICLNVFLCSCFALQLLHQNHGRYM